MVVAMAALVVMALPLAADARPNPSMTWAHAPLAAYVFPLIGLFMAPIYPAINSVVLSSLPKSRHAAMTGLIVVFSALGGTTGSFLTGQLFARLGGGTAFYLSLLPMTLFSGAPFQPRSPGGTAFANSARSSRSVAIATSGPFMGHSSFRRST